MSLSVTTAVRTGAARLLSRTGALLTAVYATLLAVYQLSINGLIAGVLPAGGSGPASVATYPAPVAVYGLAVLACFVALSAVTVVAVRTFVAGRTDTVPREFYTRRLAWATANLLVGGVVYGLLVLLGLVLLVVPGIVAYVGLIFYTMSVATEDENLVTALRRSWRLVRAEFLPVLLLVLALVVGAGVGGGVLGIAVGGVATVAGVAGWAGVVSAAVNTPLTLFVLAVLSAAFAQLREGDEGDLGGATRSDEGLADGSPASR